MDTLPLCPSAHKTPQTGPQRREKALARKGSESGAVTACCYCGKRLKGATRSRYCGNSCRVQMSKARHKQMVKTLTAAFGIPAPLGEAMIRRFKLGAVEERLNALGYYWQPSARAWVQMRETGHILFKGAA